MHLKKIAITLAVSAFIIGFSSCKKTASPTGSSTSDTTATSLSQDLAISDNISEDANNSVTAAATGYNLAGARPAGVESSCVAISVSGSFPNKTVILTFDSTVCSDGVTRSGIITAVLSDSIRRAGSTATITFSNYYVNGYNRQGTIVWTNTRSGNTVSWTRVDNGKVVAPSGRYWTLNGSRSVTQTAGDGTPLDVLDNVYSITSGSLTITNDLGASATSTVVTPLEKKAVCTHIDKGSLNITGSFGTYSILIDYGTGTCDDLATYSINGATPVQFFLP